MPLETRRLLDGVFGLLDEVLRDPEVGVLRCAAEIPRPMLPLDAL
jgi:hypothetical protein